MPTPNYDKLVDFDRLALYDEKIKQVIGTKADAADVPSATSDLTNDSGFVTDADVPSAVSELTNDSGYQTASDVSTALSNSGFQTAQDVEDAIAAGLADVTGVSYEVVQSLPQTGEAGVIYLIADPDGSAPDVYIEYIWANNAFEKIGTTGSVDLTGYVQDTDITLASNSDVNGLFSE